MPERPDSESQPRQPGRPRKDIHDEVLKIIIQLVSGGFSDRRVTAITKVPARQWRRAAADGRKVKLKTADGERKVSFGELLDQAEAERAGGLASLLVSAMKAGIRKGNPWWARLAIHNYKTGFRDPDVAAPLQLKRRMDRDTASEGDASDYLEDPTLQTAMFPPGAVPSEPNGWNH